MKILIVDDFSTMRRIVRGTLKQMGFKNIFEAEDGNLGLQELKKQNIGLVLADWNMPNMTGLDLLRAVRADENLKNIPFIMITAEGQKKNILDAIKAGVSNYIVKPFTAEILIEKIKTVLG